ncbi:MAG: nuclear transport factor 2 family protein [Chloroflexi bacterium]|nr:MAG: nuclear transport factor 2 family protein [Chloroflexota bacterium]
MDSYTTEAADSQENSFRIIDADQFVRLWSKTYNAQGNPDWSHILPYYDANIHFRDSVQELRGIDHFQEMVQRLVRRSGELRMRLLNVTMQGNIIHFEWEMTILFRKTRTSVLYGASRLTLNEQGKIVEQRDYYDLWGDILDNIPAVSKLYRTFMRRVFG